MPEILLKEESYKVVGSCMAVYNEMGSGFLEAVYQECLEMEFADQDLPFESHRELKLTFKGRSLKSTYVPDFICFGQIILEIKGVNSLNDVHRSQTINYLKATSLRLGLLVNFGNPSKLEYERIVC